MAEPASLNLPGPVRRATGGDRRTGELHLVQHSCFICSTTRGELAELWGGKWMCRDRVPCYRRWLKALGSG